MESAAATHLADSWMATRRTAWTDPDSDAITRTLMLLPSGGIWVVADNGEAAFGLSPDDVLFTITAPKESIVHVTSRPLNGKDIVIGFHLGHQTNGDTDVVRKTDWTFRYQDQSETDEAWQHMSGTVIVSNDGNERLDPHEELARKIASRAGWTVASAPSGSALSA